MPAKRVVIRDHTSEANLFARRSVVALLIAFCMLLMVVSRLHFLQIESFEGYQTRSNGNRIKVLPVAPNRGFIYDRNGVLLATNKPVFSLEVVPEEVDDIEQQLLELSQLLNITPEQKEDFIANSGNSHRRFKPVTLKGRMTPQEVAMFSANQHKYPGFSVQARLVRHYPYKGALTHVLGYVARINKEELNKIELAGNGPNYKATHGIGKRGIEKFHEDKLHGSVGYQEVEVNNRGRIIRTLNFSPPTPGQDIVLNLDVNLQLTAQQALNGKRGAVVALDPRDGGVLALYSNPSYDPNLFVQGISQKDYQEILSSPDKPLINRATQGQYPPASTIKPHLALLGLEENIINEETSIKDRGRYKLKNVNHVWRDHKPYGHGDVNVNIALQKSCDTFFYDLAYRLGIDRISVAMEAFGFGESTGIDIHEEYSGIMPSRGWKRARHNLPWYIGDTIPVGIGQSYWTATPLQLAHSITTLVNGGTRYTPQLLRGKIMPEGTELVEKSENMPVIIKDPRNLEIVLQAMDDTVNVQGGTAYNAFKNTPYRSGGKTGTAQLISIGQDEKYDEKVIDKRYHDNAMYVGYAPVEAPQIAISVALENAGHGGAEAAPIARKMMDYYFKDQAITQLVANQTDSKDTNATQ